MSPANESDGQATSRPPSIFRTHQLNELTKIYLGNVLDALKALPDETVHCVVTSPPYWGLRDYGLEPQIWGGDGRCQHEWGGKQAPHAEGAGKEGNAHSGQFCVHCCAWKGSLGLEPTTDLYVRHLVQSFREVWRVLRKDGTVWLNLGDSHFGGSGTGSYGAVNTGGRRVVGLKAKDLVGIPWAVAFALRADGWYLRADAPWFKRNCMPSSCRDRPTIAHEHVFLLTKSRDYYYDYEAVLVEWSDKRKSDIERALNGSPQYHAKSDTVEGRRQRLAMPNMRPVGNPNTGRNRRTSDWFFDSLRAILDGGQGLLQDDEGNPLAFVINPRGYAGAHFAVFPEALVEPMILAGTSEKGCCEMCGAPYERVVVKKPSTMNIRVRDAKKGILGKKSGFGGRYTATCDEIESYETELTGFSKTIGWRATCKCNAEAEPCLVLDIFAGSGTTLAVAQRLGRRSIGIELNPNYIGLIKERCSVQSDSKGAKLRKSTATRKTLRQQHTVSQPDLETFIR